MNIVFVGTTGIHHVLLATHYYLYNRLPENWEDIKYFGNVKVEQEGLPIYIDNDNKQNRIFALGVGADLAMAKKSIDQLVLILGKSQKDLLVRPIRIKGEKLILWLNRWITKKKPVKLNNQMIKMFISPQIPIIKKQVLDFKQTLPNNNI